MQRVASHAERFRELVVVGEWAGGRPVTLDQAWLTGRAEEIETMVALAVVDWSSGRVSAGEAARSLAAYLDELHESGRACGALLGEYSCCRHESEATVVCLSDGPTRFYPERARVSQSEPDDDTLLDPASVLADLCAVAGGGERRRRRL